MLKVQHLLKSYGDLQVLKGVDLEVGTGEIVSIVGKSGSGKSTLLQILGTLERADQGRVLINDTDTSSLRGNQLARFRNRHIGFVFQFHHLLPEFTARENIMIPSLIAGMRQSEAVRQADQLLQFLGLAERAEHKPGALSGGEQQRVAIARALINKPDMVLADEPSGNLDSQASDELHRLIWELREQYGQTFIIVTHNKELADRADRKLLLHDGLLTSQNKPNEKAF